jgi:hypothetical protein
VDIVPKWSQVQKWKELKFLLDAWREKGPLIKVKSCHVVPDSSNRGHTGLFIDHVHFIASNILKSGFRSWDGDVAKRRKVQPHDIPVLCRGDSTCPTHTTNASWPLNPFFR